MHVINVQFRFALLGRHSPNFLWKDAQSVYAKSIGTSCTVMNLIYSGTKFLGLLEKTEGTMLLRWMQGWCRWICDVLKTSTSSLPCNSIGFWLWDRESIWRSVDNGQSMNLIWFIKPWWEFRTYPNTNLATVRYLLLSCRSFVLQP